MLVNKYFAFHYDDKTNVFLGFNLIAHTHTYIFYHKMFFFNGELYFVHVNFIPGYCISIF